MITARQVKGQSPLLGSWMCVCVYVCACMHAQLCLTFCDPWTITHQAPLSMEFSRQEYWSWLVLPTPVHLPHPKIKPTSPVSPVSLPLSHQQGLFSSSFLTQAAPVKYKTQSKPSGNAVERMNNVINMWMKLYSINWLLIIPCLRLWLRLANIKSIQQCWWISTSVTLITYWEVSHYLNTINLTCLRYIYIKYLGWFNLFFFI